MLYKHKSNNLYLKRYAIPLLFLPVFLFSPSTIVKAVTLDKSTYYSSEPITTIDEGGPVIIFSLDNGGPVGGAYSYTPGWTIDPNSVISRGNYSIVEFAAPDTQCFLEGLTYDECKQIPEFINEFLFSVTAAPWGTGGGSDEEEGGGGSISSNPPQINITSPKVGDFVSKDVTILYDAMDPDDNSSRMKDQNGLGDKPVSLFYTDIFTRWYELSNDDQGKTLIEKDLPAVGPYIWKGALLLEQKFYQIIGRVVDKAGNITQTISDLFGVDTTAPTFIVNTNPKVAKHEKVTITIESSEELTTMPIVSVKQRGANGVKITVSGSDKKYVGTYDVVDGYDGTAQIEISGTDKASNVGTTIMSGGTFNVGINPPSKPTIISPTNNEKVATEKIDIKGSTRDDVEVLVTVNGVDKYKATPDKNGDFAVKDVILKKNSTNGKNVITVAVKDPAGALSEEAITNVFYNLPPKVEIIQPIGGALLSGMVTIITESSDENSDKVNFRYEISKSKSAAGWQTIESVPSDKINFNTTKFIDGEYSIRVTADDGASFTVSNIININIRNETSFYIRFYDGLRTIIKGHDATIRGVVFADKKVIPAPTIKSLEYSRDNGKKWIKVNSLDGSFDSGEERFSVQIRDLKEGLNNTLWRTKDSRGIVVRSDQPILVDNIAPLPPRILSPEDGAIITKYDNDLSEKGKFNFTVRGTSEPESIVTLEINGKKFTSRASFDNSFRITGIELPKVGKYTLNINAVDEALNQSTSVQQKLIYNNPINIVFISPRDGKGLGNNNLISWIMSDPDGGTISNKVLSYRKIGGEFLTIAKDISTNEFKWDNRSLPSGNNYELRMQASDGLATTTKTIPFLVDRNPPQISLFDIATQNIYKGGLFEATGKALDKDGGVEYVEYSFMPVYGAADKSTSSWYKAIINNKSGSKEVSFSIKTNLNLSDGKYQVNIRAVDMSGNVSETNYQTLTIDTTPPHVGSIEATIGGVKLLPRNDVWSAPAGTIIEIKLSLERDTKEAYLMHDNVKTNLTHNLSTDLWSGEISFKEEGNSNLMISATDIFNNTLIDKDLVTFNVIKKGKVTYMNDSGVEVPLSGATINAVYLGESSSFWSVFRSKKIISTTTDENGEYNLLLPEGAYDLTIMKEGFDTLRLGEFTYDRQTLFTSLSSLSEAKNKVTLWSKLFNMLQFN